MKRRVYRLTDNKVIAGVCSGLGEYFDIDPTWVRLLFLLSIFANGLGILAYVVAWIVIPAKPVTLDATAAPPASSEGETPLPVAAKVRNGKERRGMGFWPGLILIIIGMLFLSHQYFFWIDFDHIWPIILIGLGAVLIYRAARPQPSDAESPVTHPRNAEAVNDN